VNQRPSIWSLVERLECGDAHAANLLAERGRSVIPILVRIGQEASDDLFLAILTSLS
jgi:hypothetical protein